MRDVRTPGAIRATLQYVLGCDAPAEHRTILIEALTRLLRDQEQEDEQERLTRDEVQDWQSSELAHLEHALEGKLAKSWQDADETLVLLASQLRRRADQVKAKAVERGFAAAVDFAAAKAETARSWNGE